MARPTFGEVAAAIKIGIKAEDKVMSHAEQMLLQSSILRRMDEDAGAGGSGPRFVGCSLRDGWLCITCANAYSQKWMMERVSAFKPWDGARLSVMQEKDFPKPYIGIIRIPGPPEDPGLMLRRIKFQNDHLDCAGWRLLNSKRIEDGQTLTVSMAQSSYEDLRRHGLRISINFGTITVRIKAPKATETGTLPADPAGRIVTDGPSTAPPVNQQSDSAPTEQPSAPVATPFPGGNADIFDPQQPGPSGTNRVQTREPAAASSTSGMSQVLARGLTAAARSVGARRGVSGATIGPADSFSKILTGRSGSGRATGATTLNMPPITQRGAMRRGRGRGTSKVPCATKPTLKALVPKKP